MIVGPPTNPKRFLKASAAALEEAENGLDDAVETVKASAGEGSRLLYQFLVYGGCDPEVAADVLSADYLAKKALASDGIYTLEDVRHDIETVLGFGADHARYLSLSAGAASSGHQSFWLLAEHLDKAAAGAERYGFVPGDPANDDDDEYVAAMALLEGLQEVRRSAAAARDILTALHEKMGAFVEARACQHQRGGWRPSHDKIEMLWHATSHASQIEADGFSDARPSDRKGLGAFGVLQTVSMTYDRQLADNIAQIMRAVWDISHGNTTAAEIVAMIRAENIETKCNMVSLMGSADLDGFTTTSEALRLYRIFLAFTDTVDDPVLVGIEELGAALANVRREDIGVLECEVGLDGSEDYLVAEAEFRVKPNAIRSVRRIDAVEKSDSLSLAVPGM